MTDLAAVQDLHIRLLYSMPVVKAFRADARALLISLGIDPVWQKALPDPCSEAHLVEMRGRRLQAAQELVPSFQPTFARLLSVPPSAHAVAASLWFEDFLASKEFLDPAWSLPHVSGIGRGYDGASRFFFWARRYFDLRETAAPVLLRDDLYLDFAANLDQEQINATIPEWDRFHGGFFWVVTPGSTGPCRGLTRERVVFSDVSTDSALHLRSEGLLDLDDLNP